MQPDPTYKQIFANEYMVEELMRWFVADLHGAGELVDALDFGEMLRLHEQSVTGTAEDPHRYADDMVWRVRFRGRSEEEGDDAWLYLVLILEFEAEVDFQMPLRIRNYVDNFHMEQWRGKDFLSTSRLLPVLPIVIYNGNSPWSAAPRVVDLVTPGASEAWHASSSVASRREPTRCSRAMATCCLTRIGWGRTICEWTTPRRCWRGWRTHPSSASRRSWRRCVVGSMHANSSR